MLYGRQALLQAMPPWEGGGSMIATVSLTEGTTYARAPWRFEAGTPNTGGIIGLGAAFDYVEALGLNAIQEYEQPLMHYALAALCQRAESDPLWPGPSRTGVIAFNLGKHHAYDVGSFLDNYGIAVRTGHHCAMPLMAFYQVPAMCRASLVMYNTPRRGRPAGGGAEAHSSAVRLGRGASPAVQKDPDGEFAGQR